MIHEVNYMWCDYYVQKQDSARAMHDFIKYFDMFV